MTAAVTVVCPLCGDEITVPLGLTTATLSLDPATISVSIEPDVGPVVEHCQSRHPAVGVEGSTTVFDPPPLAIPEYVRPALPAGRRLLGWRR